SADGATLSRWLNSNLVDAALHFGPIPGSGFESDPLFEERLVLVSSEDRPLQRWDSNYIYVDWGERFRRDHALAYPVTETAAVTFGEGTLALSYLLQQGGSGYFPFRMVQNHLDKQTLFLVPKAPEFTRQVMLSRSPLFPPYDWYEAFRNHFMERGQGTIDP
ncbi:MAG: LysR substrate-binding domain-containing protein, partial [Pseudomonadota bacterium]